jgi:hypothetical protein
MAIFVSNTAAPVFAPPLSEGTDPNLPGLETAFTEELAAVRRMPDADAEAHVSALALKEDEKKEDTVDLQILPANVLVNAVTDANFAYALQGQVVQPGVPVGVAVSPEVPVGMSETAETAGALGGVGAVGPMGGANVSLVPEQAPPGFANPNSNLVSPVNQNGQAAKFENAAPLAINPSNLTTQVSTTPANAALAMATTPSIQVPVKNTDQSEDSAATEAAQVTQVAQATQASQALQTYPLTPADAAMPSGVDALQSVAVLSTVERAMPEGQMPADLALAPSDTNTAVKLVASTLDVASSATDSTQATAQAIAQSTAQATAQTTAQVSTLASSETPTPLPQSNLSAPALQTSVSPMPLATTVQAVAPLAATVSTETKKSTETTVPIDRASTETSSLPFDAKLGSSGAASISKDNAPQDVLAAPLGVAVSKESTDASTETLSLGNIPQTHLGSELSFEAVQRQAKIELVSSQSIQDQHETTLSAPKSFEDLSSSFVSSLVGGAPRPMATVMDLTALQSQDKTTPVTPHEARLDAGTIHMEIQRMVKQGGGHVVMEITPPDQSKFTIELKMDTQGNARLIVEGVSDSTRTRLEQSAPQLREQFQQMGMELQLDMRQQRDSGSQNAQNQDGPSERAPWMAQQADLKLPAQRATAASRALESGANQVYLYA